MYGAMIESFVHLIIFTTGEGREKEFHGLEGEKHPNGDVGEGAPEEMWSGALLGPGSQ